MRRKDREVTEINEIENIIKQCKTCHVAMVDEGEPYVIPLSFGYEILEDKSLVLYFHSAKEGRKLDILYKNPKVCFEMMKEGMPVHAETPCNSGYYYSSVIGYGEVEFIEDTDKKCKALSKMFQHQAGKEVLFTKEQADTVCVFQVISVNFTGKKKPLPNQ